MSEALKIIILAISAYFFGNINVALLISKLMKGDIRKMGSGNPGTMNMVRVFGFKMGIVTLILDLLKGLIPCLLGWLFIGGKTPEFGANRLGAYVGGLSAITGHIFPVILKFKGGKGIASTIGIGLVLQPIAGAIAFVVAVTFLIIFRLGSVSSFIAISVPIATEGFFISNSVVEYKLVSLIMLFAIFALTLFAHRGNIIRLFKGAENKTVVFKHHDKKQEAIPIFDKKV